MKRNFKVALTEAEWRILSILASKSGTDMQGAFKNLLWEETERRVDEMIWPTKDDNTPSNKTVVEWDDW